MSESRRWLGLLLLGAYALALLSIGLTRDWRLLHEDNGAMHTTLALSHLTLGLRATRAHDVFVAPETRQRVGYGHHPPGTALLVAGAFALLRADDPWVARLLPIALHLGTVMLAVELLGAIVPPGPALAGGFVLATIPMGAYFGRMVNYEPLCLFAVMLTLTGYAAWRGHGARAGLARCAAGIALGGLIDWPAFFFAAAIVVAESWDAWRDRARGVAAVGLLAVVTAATLAFDVWHLWYAGRGSIALLGSVAGGGVWWAETAKLSPMRFVGHQVETARRYFTDAGLLSGLLVAAAVAMPQTRLAQRLLGASGRGLARRLLLVTGCPSVAYVLAAPSWATAHPYWQFYALPFVVLAITLVLRHLWQRAVGGRSVAGAICLVVFLGDVAIASAVVLHVRHTRASGYAVKQTQWLRERFLAPRHAIPRPAIGGRSSSWTGSPSAAPGRCSSGAGAVVHDRFHQAAPGMARAGNPGRGGRSRPSPGDGAPSRRG